MATVNLPRQAYHRIIKLLSESSCIPARESIMSRLGVGDVRAAEFLNAVGDLLAKDKKNRQAAASIDWILLKKIGQPFQAGGVWTKSLPSAEILNFWRKFAGEIV